MTRLAAQKLTERWGQSVIVDNRPGGGTVIAMEMVVKAPPDGYTLLAASDTLMLNGCSSVPLTTCAQHSSQSCSS
jgi:tripartite-type tricarboxylate transporter receptor subunit TctC